MGYKIPATFPGPYPGFKKQYMLSLWETEVQEACAIQDHWLLRSEAERGRRGRNVPEVTQDHFPSPSPPLLHPPGSTPAHLRGASEETLASKNRLPKTWDMWLLLPSPTSGPGLLSPQFSSGSNGSPWECLEAAPAVELCRKGHTWCPTTGHSYEPGDTGQASADFSQDWS